MSSQQPIPPNPYGGGSGGQDSRGFAPGQSPSGNLMFQYSAPPSNPASPPRQGMQSHYPGAQPPPPPPPPQSRFQPHPQAYMHGYSQGSPMPATARTNIWLGHQTHHPAEPLSLPSTLPSTPPSHQAPPTVAPPTAPSSQLRAPQWRPTAATPHMAVNAAYAERVGDDSAYVEAQKRRCKYHPYGCKVKSWPSMLQRHEQDCDKAPERRAPAAPSSFAFGRR